MSGHPTIISFWYGADYYRESADRLRADCERLGLEHDIVELHGVEGLDWTEICRRKVRFYRERIEDHDGPVMWVDADCRILRRPEPLRDCGFDIAGFVRGFKQIRDYDPYVMARFWVPGILFFNRTPAAARLLDLMGKFDDEVTDRVTDDWLLQQAWAKVRGPLNVGLLAPSLVVRNVEQAKEDTIFVYGDSGFVADYKGTVLQHKPRDLMKNPRVAERVLELHRNPKVRAETVYDVGLDFMKARDFDVAVKLMRSLIAQAPDDLPAVRKYANVLRACGEVDEAYAALKPFTETDQRSEATQAIVHVAMTAGDHETARRIITELLGSEDDEMRAFAQSAAYDLELETRAADAGLTAAQRTDLWWMKRPYPGSVANLLAPYIVDKITGRPPRFIRPTHALLSVGSILQYAGNESQVWGAGVANAADKLCAQATYHAVRGPLTRAALVKAGATVPEVYGDPALLLPRLYTPSPKTPAHAVGVIMGGGRGNLQLAEGVRKISLLGVGNAEVEDFVDAILDCEVILSPSLQGLIVAHAYGVPARWAQLAARDAAAAGNVEFGDYFDSVGMPAQTPLDLTGADVIDESLARNVDRTVDLRVNADDLLEAFPHPEP